MSMHHTLFSSNIYWSHCQTLTVYLRCKNVPSLPPPVNATAARIASPFSRPSTSPASTRRLWVRRVQGVCIASQYPHVNISAEMMRWEPGCQNITMFCCFNKHSSREWSDINVSLGHIENTCEMGPFLFCYSILLRSFCQACPLCSFSWDPHLCKMKIKL